MTLSKIVVRIVVIMIVIAEIVFKSVKNNF